MSVELRDRDVRGSARFGPAARAALLVVGMLWTVGCDRSAQRSASGPVDEITYPIPADGFSVRRVAEDAERILSRKITCTECALADSRPIRIAGLPRTPRADALRLFQAIFLTHELSLVVYGGEPRRLLECLD